MNVQHHALFWAAVVLAAPLQAQTGNCVEPTAFELLDANNLRVGFLNAGDAFWDANASAQFYHKLDSAHTIFAGSLWMAGFDQGGNLRLAAQTFRDSGTDYWAGPLDSNGVTVDTTCANFDRIWKVARPDIETLLADFNDNQNVDNAPAASLLGWPGRGNPHFLAHNGFHLPYQDLAPFYDQNSDGIYNPYDGDYPIYREGDATAVADEMLWTVFNDNGNIHTESNGQPVVMEVHRMAYAFSCNDDPVLQNTIFMRYKLINRGLVQLDSFYYGLWHDFDLGCYNDDLAGCAPAQNTVYAYNGSDNDDIACGNGRGFGAHPPVQTVTFLNQTLAHHIAQGNFGPTPTGLAPYYYLSGRNNDGLPISHNGVAYDHMFPGLPSDTTTWSMANDSIIGFGVDFRSVASVEVGTLLPGAVHILDVAYGYHRDTAIHSPAAMVDFALPRVSHIQSVYNDDFQSLCTLFSGDIKEEVMDGRQENPRHRLYPNPNKGTFTLEFEYDAPRSLAIYDAWGRLVQQQTLAGDRIATVTIDALPAGFYYYTIEDSKGAREAGKMQVSE